MPASTTIFNVNTRLINLALLACLSGIISCKKEYECECITTTTQQGVEPLTESMMTGKIKRKERKSECNLNDFQYRNGDPTSGITHLVTRDCSPK